MRTALLLTTLLLSGCASAWSARPPGHRYGVLHGAVAAGAVLATKEATGNPWYGFVASCVGFAAHEWEESRGFSNWGAGGKVDGVLDMVVPCALGIGLSLRLR